MTANLRTAPRAPTGPAGSGRSWRRAGRRFALFHVSRPYRKHETPCTPFRRGSSFNCHSRNRTWGRWTILLWGCGRRVSQGKDTSDEGILRGFDGRQVGVLGPGHRHSFRHGSRCPVSSRRAGQRRLDERLRRLTSRTEGGVCRADSHHHHADPELASGAVRLTGAGPPRASPPKRPRSRTIREEVTSRLPVGFGFDGRPATTIPVRPDWHPGRVSGISRRAGSNLSGQGIASARKPADRAPGHHPGPRRPRPSAFPPPHPVRPAGRPAAARPEGTRMDSGNAPGYASQVDCETSDHPAARPSATVATASPRTELAAVLVPLSRQAGDTCVMRLPESELQIRPPDGFSSSLCVPLGWRRPAPFGNPGFPNARRPPGGVAAARARRPSPGAEPIADSKWPHSVMSRLRCLVTTYLSMNHPIGCRSRYGTI